MILYKYLPKARALEVIRDGKIHFALPKYFNDPFDTPLAVREEGSDLHNQLFGDLRAAMKSSVWGRNTGILSLTRTPVNMLMWAHYADSHQGVVIGIDVGVAGFLDTSANVIPAQFGSVVYSRQRVTGGFATKEWEPTAVGATYHFQMQNFEKTQRLFLMKPLDWAYEEEVRVAKCVRGLGEGISSNVSGEFTMIIRGENPYYLYHLPNGSVKELYVGYRTELDDIVSELPHSKDIRVYSASLVQNSYDIEFHAL